MHRTLLSVWNTALNVVLYPPTWLHEQTHYAVLRPYAEDVEREWSPLRNDATLRLDLRGVPVWRHAFGALAPTVIGLACAILAVLVSFTGLYPVSVRGELVQWLAIGGYWFTYTVPSAADIQDAATAVLHGGGGE